MVGYTAVENFDRSYGQNWVNYVRGSRVNLGHLKEVVSIDAGLCPIVIGDPTEADRGFRMLIDDCLYDIFSDLDYMIGRIRTDRDYQILAVIHKPKKRDVENFRDARFVFKGYDLMEDATQTSALTNCGGVFDWAYRGADLSESGLVTDYDKARKIRIQLRNAIPMRLTPIGKCGRCGQ